MTLNKHSFSLLFALSTVVGRCIRSRALLAAWRVQYSGSMLPVVSVTCSATPPRITATFSVSFGRFDDIVLYITAGTVRVTRVQRGDTTDVPLDGTLFLHSRQGGPVCYLEV